MTNSFADLYQRTSAVLKESNYGVSKNLQGFFGVDDGVPAGFQRVEGEVIVDSPASDDELARLREAVDAHCPVLDDLIRAVPVDLDLKRGSSDS